MRLKIGKISLVQIFLGILLMFTEGRDVSIGDCGLLSVFQANAGKSLSDGTRGYAQTFGRTEGRSLFLGSTIDFTLRLPWFTVQAPWSCRVKVILNTWTVLLAWLSPHRPIR